MRNRGVDRDHQIAQRDSGGGVGEAVQLATDMRHALLGGERVSVFSAHVALNADEAGWDGE